MDLSAAIETLSKQKLHFEQKCRNLEEMETLLRKALVDREIEIASLKEKIRKLESSDRSSEPPMTEEERQWAKNTGMTPEKRAPGPLKVGG